MPVQYRGSKDVRQAMNLTGRVRGMELLSTILPYIKQFELRTLNFVLLL